MMRTIFCFSIFVFLIAAPARAEEDESVWFKTYEQIDYSDLRKLIDEKQVDSARVLNSGWWVTIKTKDGKFFDTRVTPQTPIADHFYVAGIPVKIEHRNEDNDELPFWLDIFLNILPLLIFVVFFIFILWFSQKRGRKVQDECLDRAKEINDEFLDRQQEQFEAFIENFSSLLEKKDSNG
ncbi:MAG: hypothetical protein GXP06_00710 [Alphaproteobacteria bacterium]|nr:hypothetical protein [Alphaproteobacteria bacterium]